MTPEMAAEVVAALAEMPNVPRRRTGQVQNRTYSYADLLDVLTAVRPVLAAHHLAVLQAPCVVDGTLGLRTTLLHASGESVSEVLPIGQVDDPRALGSAVTYARRYALIALLGLATEEDDDAEAAMPAQAARGGGAQPAPRRAPKASEGGVTPAQLGRIQAVARELGLSRDALAGVASDLVGRELESARDLTKSEASELIEHLEELRGEEP